MTAGFKAGDTVRLRSGGPAMTVDNVVGERVSVFWTDAGGARQQEEYQAAMLEAVEGGR